MSKYPEEVGLVEVAKRIWDGDGARIRVDIAIEEKLISHLSEFFSEKPVKAFITDSDIRHIKKKHGGAENQRGQKTISPEDFAHIPVVLNEFDSCEHTDTDKLDNKMFLLRKRIEDDVFLVTVQRGKSKLGIKTMWIKNQSGASC